MNTFPVFKFSWKALAVIVFGVVISAFFFGRKPVVLVTDKPFDQLYGEGRARYERYALSFRFFRQIKTIAVAEGAGPDLVAQAAISLSRRPLAVFFPYRYREGARRYLKDKPDAAVVILGGRNHPETAGEGEEPRWLCTDTAADLYRAGVLAGELALQDADGRAAALYQGGLSDAEKTAFNRGLKDQGWDGKPFISSNNEPVSRFLGKEIACLVLSGKSDTRFFEDSGSLILFTWADPALASAKLAAVFDDSPWAQLNPALKLLKKGINSPETAELDLIPSRLTILVQNNEQKLGTIEINRIKSLKYVEEKPENNRSNV